MHWIRLRAIGPCEGRQLEQFAVLSYAPRSVDSIRLAYPVRKFPDFSQKFGKGRVSSYLGFDINLINYTILFSSLIIQMQHAARMTWTTCASLICRHMLKSRKSQVPTMTIDLFLDSTII